MSTDNLTLAYLTLTRARGLGPRKIKLLVEALGGAEAVLAADEARLQQIDGVGPSLIRALQEAKASDWAGKESQRVQQLGLNLLHLEHPAYPDCLRAIYDPPSVLYVRGSMPSFEATTPRSIGIVGTRDASEHALHLTRTLAARLAEAGVKIVSGLALGVDSAAHQGTLDAGGVTVAVLGSAVDVIYPYQNYSMAQAISEGRGAIISEFPIGTRPNARNFPGRNRIINGLSRGVVVVEAGKKSGALITADYALDEGRIVFSVPGRVGDPRSSGTLGLLKQGAVLVEDASDVLNEFAWTGSAQLQSSVKLTSTETVLVNRIHSFGEALLDDLIEEGVSAASLLPILIKLELKGAIKTLPSGRYVALVDST